ncbi:WD40 repeat-like protein [Viridothelium virens]|uniref:WD40 repeat-like protein n=1 Tax=Viridothelium virens TaxID=1048519 RepID=A0A6A6H855_VIRVR|nr:WD40 repeat-like protein [Viridothelium virens]
MRIQTLDLEPSCVAFAPDDTDHFVVGTYHLNSKTEKSDNSNAQDTPSLPQSRSGSLILYRLQGENLITQQTIKTDNGILDIAFSPSDYLDTGDTTTGIAAPSHRNLAVALSGGQIVFIQLECSPQAHWSSGCRLTNIENHQPFHESVLVLDIVWHPKRKGDLAVTLSTGEVVLCSLRRGESNTHIQTTQLFSHSLEAWTLSFSIDGRSLYSGGDDCVFACHDSEGADHAALWKDRRIHGAGVTAILPILSDFSDQNDHYKEALLTGSYDDHIRVLATPTGSGKRVTVLAELNLGGGVWRLTFIQAPSSLDSKSPGSLSLHWTILASCMYAGVRVVEVTKQGADWDIRIVARFEEHKSMNYGSDVRPRSAGDGPAHEIVSTSFYDRLLCLWQFAQGTHQECTE